MGRIYYRSLDHLETQQQGIIHKQRTAGEAFFLTIHTWNFNSSYTKIEPFTWIWHILLLANKSQSPQLIFTKVTALVFNVGLQFKGNTVTQTSLLIQVLMSVFGVGRYLCSFSHYFNTIYQCAVVYCIRKKCCEPHAIEHIFVTDSSKLVSKCVLLYILSLFYLLPH